MGAPLRRVAGLAVILALTSSAGVAAASPAITEFPAKTANHEPLGIVTGPHNVDIWYVQSTAPGIVRSTLSGEMTEFTTEHMGHPMTITAGPDGNLWFTEQNPEEIGRITTGGAIKEFPLPGGSDPVGITAGPDGNLWFTEQGNHGAIGRITPAGVITQFNHANGLTENSQPYGIAAGPEGDLWFTETVNPGAIGRITPSGEVTQFRTGLSANSEPAAITAGPDGNLWFTEHANTSAIGRITPSGTITQFTSGLSANARPLGITTGNDGNLYFTETATGRIGKVTPSGVITEQAPPNTKGEPAYITTGPDGNVWFTESANPGKIALLTVAPKVAATLASNVAEQSATLQASVGANSQATTYDFEYGTTSSYGSHSASSSAGNGAGSAPVSTPVSGLSPATEYHFRAVASNGAGTTYGPDATFTTAPAPESSEPPPSEPAPSEPEPAPVVDAGPTSSATPGVVEAAPVTGPLLAPAIAAPVPFTPPALGRTAVASVLSGSVLIRLPGSGATVPLNASGDIPVGSLLDTRHGSVVLTTAVNKQGLTQSATVWGGSLLLQQSSAAGGMTIFHDQATRPRNCRLGNRPAGQAAQATTAKARKAAPTLWAKDDNGHFSTRGQNSVATVRGTYWGTVEGCAGTVTIVRRGLVSVRSLHGHRTVLIRAGHSYLARR